MTTPKKAPKDKIYFTKEHENAIIQYAQLSGSYEERSRLYEKQIAPVLNELIEKIVHTFKFSTLPNIGHLRNECEVYLVTILDKFDPTKGYKAFAYFSVITKNWFIAERKRVTKDHRNTRYEDIHQIRQDKEENLTIEGREMGDREDSEFFSNLIMEIEDWRDMPDLLESEKRVIEAILILLNKKEEIDVLNKKAIYLYLREITGYNTKQVVTVLKKVRHKYKAFMKDWNDGEI